jgi:sensor c-di-GMP phosphodiesterase-like protein
VKVRNRYRFGRLWLAAAAILLGVLAGYIVGRESILHGVRSRLGDYASQIEQHDEEIATEIGATLAEANASPFTACSSDDLALLRRLTYAARFLKDVARLRDGSFACSATSGVLPKALPLLTPDVSLASGAALYQSYELKVQGGVHAEVVTYRNADVVLSPDTFSEFPQEPIQYAVGIPEHTGTADATTVMLTGATGRVSIPARVFNSQKTVRVADAYYHAQCSSQYPICAVTIVRVKQLWRNNGALLDIYVATGGAAGVACASVLLMAGQKRRSHTNQLKRAILMGKLSVAYQPIVELGSHRIVGAEALARWTDEDGDSIRPETILALAEAEGFVSEITRFVLTRSLEELGTILVDNPHFRLSINLAPSDLADPRLLLLLDEKLQDSPIAAKNLAFELTERATSDRQVAVAAIRRLRQRGHAVLIDDFGTGYSNLAYLTELDVDGIKINRTFIATIGTDSVTASIVPQILAVAMALNLEIIVQGIEREEQAIYFAAGNPRILGQGWFFGMPIPARSLMYLCAEKTE